MQAHTMFQSLWDWCIYTGLLSDNLEEAFSVPSYIIKLYNTFYTDCHLKPTLKSDYSVQIPLKWTNNLGPWVQGDGWYSWPSLHHPLYLPSMHQWALIHGIVKFLRIKQIVCSVTSIIHSVFLTPKLRVVLVPIGTWLSARPRSAKKWPSVYTRFPSKENSMALSPLSIALLIRKSNGERLTFGWHAAAPAHS